MGFVKQLLANHPKFEEYENLLNLRNAESTNDHTRCPKCNEQAWCCGCVDELCSEIMEDVMSGKFTGERPKKVMPLRVEAFTGMMIQEFFERLIKLAKHDIVKGVFNGNYYDLDENTTIEDLYRQMDEHEKSWRENN